MSAVRRGRALARVIDHPPPILLPSFLVPAFQSVPARRLSASARSQSKLGRTPISIPPGVELLIGEPTVKNDLTTYLKIPKRTVTVQGPLGEPARMPCRVAPLADMLQGKLDLEIPPFVHIDHDVAARRATLSIEDQDARQQKEMWGESAAWVQDGRRQLTKVRHYVGASQQIHNGRF